jgi:AcrR family transcriptional regulator
MPRIWSDTIAAHRDAVRDATLDATAALIAAHGPTGVTMSQIAKESGIGRATLYKYFPDLPSILVAWHERHVEDHLRRLSEAAEAAGPAGRLAAVLRAYAELSAGHREGGDLSALLHQGEHAVRAEARLQAFLAGLIAESAARGDTRTDVPPPELAAFCLHALAAAPAHPAPAALDRLLALTLTALRPPTARPGTGC